MLFRTQIVLLLKHFFFILLVYINLLKSNSGQAKTLAQLRTNKSAGDWNHYQKGERRELGKIQSCYTK